MGVNERLATYNITQVASNPYQFESKTTFRLESKPKEDLTVAIYNDLEIKSAVSADGKSCAIQQ